MSILLSTHELDKDENERDYAPKKGVKINRNKLIMRGFCTTQIRWPVRCSFRNDELQTSIHTH